VSTPAPLSEVEHEAFRGQEPVAYADPMAFLNFKTARESGHKGRGHSREWMWAQFDEGLVPLYTHPCFMPPHEAIAAFVCRYSIDDVLDAATKAGVTSEQLNVIRKALANATRARMSGAPS
jgi:hypothetical protein